MKTPWTFGPDLIMIIKDEVKTMLEFCTLGTGGTLPIPERALSSLYVRVSGRSMLIDCGEGTQVGIRKLGWGFRCREIGRAHV